MASSSSSPNLFRSITPVASAAAPLTPQGNTPLIDTNSLLLRDWSSDRAAIPSPPVAPAIVLNETSGGSTGTPQSNRYPVATFVSNLVRTSVNELRDHIGSQIYASAIPENEPGLLSSSRSAPPARTATTAGVQSLEEESSEFVLIDGDLVALPQHVPTTRSAMNSSEVLQEAARCRTSRVKKGVKKFKKFWKKKKSRKDTDDGAESLATDQPSVATSNSIVSDSPSKRKVKKKKNRLAWRRDVESPPTTQMDRGTSQSSLILPPSVPTPGATIDIPTIAGGASSIDASDLPPTEASITSLAPVTRQTSIAAEASFVGNAEAVVLPFTQAEAYIEDRLEDYDKYEKQPYLRSMVPPDADFKVDKLEAPCVDSMLQRAGEFAEDVEETTETPSPLPIKKGKSDGGSVPFSIATADDPLVHNDQLKIVMVGVPEKSGLARSLRGGKPKKHGRKRAMGVDVHTWTPKQNIHQQERASSSVQCSIWDVQGNSTTLANFGAHPGTQSLFFSDRALYLLVWDLGVQNKQSYRRQVRSHEEQQDSDDEDNDDDDDYDNEYLREEFNRQADRALQTDIEERVLPWVDRIAKRGSHSAILPVALVDESKMSPDEAKRRCDAMQASLMEYTERYYLNAGGEEMTPPPKVLSGAETVLCVSLESHMGMELLEETIVAIATDVNHSVFDHVGTAVPRGTLPVLETSRRLKQEHKLVLVDHLMAELPGEMKLSGNDVVEALHFLASIGELMYFGDMDEILSHYVILSRKWLVSALSCILRNDLKRELSETRRFMNMQCLYYSDQQFPENHVTQTFSIHSSTCPLLSSGDTQMLWQSMSFMREAADRSSHSASENPAIAQTMFGFLEHLLVHAGVFMPLDIDRFASPENVYFVPSLLSSQGTDTHNVWTYKSNESWTTTLSHSWLFRDGAPSGLMEQVTVALLRDLYEFSHVVPPGPRSTSTAAIRPSPVASRSNTFPFAQNSLTDFMDNHDGETIGHTKIHQIVCWKDTLFVKIGCVFSDGHELRESFVEIFVAVADQSSAHCVASDAMRPNMQRLIVSGKGQVGHHGRKLWKGGYGLVVDSIKASLAHCTNVDRQVVCPECLAHSHPSCASTWGWDSVRAAAESGSTVVRCMRGHRVDSNLICGTTPAIRQDLGHTTGGGLPGPIPKKLVRELLPSVVLVGLWDSKNKTLRSVGSGFIADKKAGLVVTASHVLFDMEEGRNFGRPYFGLKHAKAVIGVIPDGNDKKGKAFFRYFADIVADDIHNMDACVLKITTRLENDIEDETQLGEQPETCIDLMNENLVSLKMTRRFELEESVRILGFNQGGEGILEQGKHVNRSADFAKGYICKQFKMADDDNSASSNDSSSSGSGFVPREEIVVICPNIVGHSGGPCVNDEGKVVGILSRADPVDRQRCYLVPTNELKSLIAKAKKGWKRY